MQPFEQASRALRESADYPVNISKKAALTAVGSAAGYLGLSSLKGILPKIQAFVSDFLPEKISSQGLKSVDPRMKNFIDKAEEEGYDFSEIKSFIKQKLNKEEPINKVKENPIQKYSSDLHDFIVQEIGKGRSPLQAGALAEMGVGGKNFNQVIGKLKKDLNSTWANIVESVYGSSQQAQPQQPQSPQQAPQQAASTQPIQAQSGDKWSQIASQLQNLLNS